MKTKQLSSTLVLASLISAIWLAPPNSHAQTINTWITGGDGKWETAGNWSAGSPTNTQALVSIANAPTKTVTIDATTSGSYPGTLTISNLLVSAPAGTTNTLALNNSGTTTPLHVLSNCTLTTGSALTITNAALQVDGASGTPLSIDGFVTLSSGQILCTNAPTAVGNTAVGQMTVSNGTWQGQYAYVGYNAGSQGTLTIAGGTNSLSAYLSAGEKLGATGTVWLTGGQLVTTNISIGEGLIGNYGVGQMTVSNGSWQAYVVNVGVRAGSRGTLTFAGGTNSFAADGALETANNAGANGTIWLTGGRLVTTNAYSYISFSGVGQMIVSNGSWQGKYAYVGCYPGSQGTLTIAGGTNSLSDSLWVGYLAGATGAVWLTGGELFTTNSSSYISYSGVGQMTVSNGIWQANSAYVGNNAGSQGTLTIAGGTNSLSSYLYAGLNAGATGTIWVTGGQLIVTNSFDSVFIGEHGAGQMTVSNGLWIAHRPWVGDFSSGTLTIAGGTNVFTNYSFIGNNPSSTGTVWLTGGRLVTTNASTAVELGDVGSGQLTVSNGTWLGTEVDLGVAAPASGTLTIAGGTTVLSGLEDGMNSGATGTVWLTGGQLVTMNSSEIGFEGVGQMIVSNGTWQVGEVDVGYVAGSQGTLTIAGGTNSLSSALYAGEEAGATGAVWLTGGQLFTTNASSYIAGSGSGQMTVSNGTWQAYQVYVGITAGSEGTLTVAGGTNLLLSEMLVGYSAGATGTVWVTGGQLNSSCIIGYSGVGQMTVSNGLWQAAQVYLGYYTNAQGTLTVAGGTNSIYSSMQLGRADCAAAGTLTVSGGSLYVTNAAHNAYLDVEDGRVTLNGGLLVVDKLIVTNACGHFVHTGGTLSYTQLVLDPNQSAVGDGIPNGWKQQYGLDPFDPNLGSKDADGDGMSNLQEYLAGTDPTNANSALRITAITPAGADMRVYFTSVGGKYYSLERCDSIGGAWTDIVTNIPGNDGIQWVKDIGGATRASAFYRIILSQLSSPPPVDSDGDGIADSWTQQYFGHPTGEAYDHSLATDDPDGDGLSNLQEFLAGTDPTNSAASFRVTSIVTTGNDLVVTWTMGSGKTNALQATDGGGYGTNGFADIFTVTNTLGTVTNYLDVGGATNVPARFYRVRLAP